MNEYDYIKKRDEILEGISIGISGEYPHNATITLRGADQAARAIDALVLEVIGEDKTPAREASPLEKQLFTDYKRIDYQNELRAEQRKTVRNSQ